MSFPPNINTTFAANQKTAFDETHPTDAGFPQQSKNSYASFPRYKSESCLLENDWILYVPLQFNEREGFISM